jgi:enoyl-CoA hydratase/carnithine racemase
MTEQQSQTHLTIHRDGPLLEVTLDRAERFNALNDKLVDELRDLFNGLYWQHDIRVVLLRAQGKNFCAGLDMQERTGGLATSGDALIAQRKISEIVIAMRRCPQPIVSLIQGAASGGGFAIALASDVRIMSDDARMNAAFIRVGLGGCDIGSSYFLPRMVGSSVASEYLLTGRFMSAERAYALGLASALVTRAQLAEEGRKMVADMLHATPLGLRLTKEALNQAIDATGLEAVIAMEDRNQVLCSQSEDFAEGIAAFLQKRRPSYAQ